MTNQVAVNGAKKPITEVVILANDLGEKQKGNVGVFPKDWQECREGVVFPWEGGRKEDQVGESFVAPRALVH